MDSSDTAGAEVRTLHSPKRDHVANTRVTNDVGAFLRNHANGRAQGTNEGSVSSTHYVLPLLLQTPRDTKLLPVVQLRSGVILLMGDSLALCTSYFSSAEDLAPSRLVSCQSMISRHSKTVRRHLRG